MMFELGTVIGIAVLCLVLGFGGALGMMYWAFYIGRKEDAEDDLD